MIKPNRRDLRLQIGLAVAVSVIALAMPSKASADPPACNHKICMIHVESPPEDLEGQCGGPPPGQPTGDCYCVSLASPGTWEIQEMCIQG